MHFELNEEQKLIRKMVRDFAENEVKPIAQEIDKEHRFPMENFRKMGKLGFFGLPFPEEYGGMGGDSISYAIAMEEISRACGSTGITFVAQTSLSASPIYRFGNEEQKQKFLVPLAKGEKIGSFGLTEPEAGSDAGATKTTAVLDGDEWVVNGQKNFITNGSIADTVVFTAKTDPTRGTHGISSFIVEKGTSGFRPGRDEDKMGLCASITSELFFEDCRIPKENLLGNEGDGFKQFLITLDAGRIGIGAMALGLAQAAFEAALEYSKEREQFGRPICNFQVPGCLAQGSGSAFHQGGGHGQAVRLRDGRTGLLQGYSDPRWLRLHTRVRRGALLPRPAAVHHRRGDQRDPAIGHCPRTAGAVG
jgi:alkylation response protein AidB-like acyl-CoA dehydrogenase